jgi:hypothetical protein
VSEMGRKRMRLFKPTAAQLAKLASGRLKSPLYRAGKKRHDENLASGKKRPPRPKKKGTP